uniref:Flagellar L-ring protein n=1 Tax=Pseudomonas putida TaxID=303 RepID=FLGH_PSEPU|nr:RecName: Full=Flagellar L-ring protein; AltName: Full=Basal body L-ring protein; Flags: Precursor [Pseudomonas putida]AAA62845.1 flagellar L-ring protein [Pseudomonas putida]
MNRLLSVFALGGAVLLAGCVAPTPSPTTRTMRRCCRAPRCRQRPTTVRSTRPVSSRTCTATARRSGWVTSSPSRSMSATSASKNAGSQIAKTSKTDIGLTSLFGSTPNTNNPFGGGDLSLEAGYSGDRATKGDSKATQGNTLTGSITVTVAEVLPNGNHRRARQKWLTLNTGEELVRIAGMVRADDIATDNTVPSTRVADARITYSGTGSFADASQPGWLDRFFISPLWPF